MERGSLLRKDIEKQPDVLERFLDESRGKIAEIARLIKKIDPAFIYMVGRGSSENAARYAQYALGEMGRLPVCLGNPSLFSRYSRHPRLKGSVVIAVSQSGASPDVVSVAKAANTEGVAVIAITNNSESALALQSDHIILLRADERSVAATQTFINSIAAFAALAAALTGSREMGKELWRVPSLVQKTIEDFEPCAAAAVELAEEDKAFVLGRGYNYSTACEAALKLKELTYILAQSYSSAEFLHGAIAVVDRGFPVLLVAGQGKVFRDIPVLCERLESVGGKVFLIGNESPAKGKHLRQIGFPTCPEWISPFPAAVRAQQLSLLTSLMKGIDPDRPRSIVKITKTV